MTFCEHCEGGCAFCDPNRAATLLGYNNPAECPHYCKKRPIPCSCTEQCGCRAPNMACSLKPMLILLDIDNVLNAFVPKLFHVYNTMYNGALKEEDHTDFWFENVFSQDVCNRLYDIFSQPNFFRELPVCLEAKEVVRHIKLLGHTIEVCTARPSLVNGKTLNPHSVCEKLEWLEEHFPELVDNVTITKSKHMVRGDMLIDDSLEHIEAWCEVNPEGIGYLIAKPWNADRDLPENAVRGSLEELPLYLRNDRFRRG